MNAQANAFWKWFEANNTAYLFLGEMDEEIKQRHLNELVAQLHEFSPDLYFEIGGVPDNDQELIITAEGKTDHFEAVRILINAAPAIKHWKFIAFVPPRGTSFEIAFNEFTIKASEVHFLPMENPMQPDALGLKIQVPGYEQIKDSEWLQPAVLKILESILGEESFSLDVQHVDISPLPEQAQEAVMLPISQLQAFIKWRKEQHAKMVLLN